MTTTSPRKTIADIIETVPCGRCGGNGQFGPASVWAGRCFTCAGTGTVATKRGAAARAFYRDLIRTPVEAIRPGDRVRMEATMFSGAAWTTVEEIIDCAAAADLQKTGSASILQRTDIAAVDAAVVRGATIVPSPYRDTEVYVFEGITIRCRQDNGEGFSISGASGTQLVALDPAVTRAILATVAEYQDSLTKQGKPKKGSRWAA